MTDRGHRGPSAERVIAAHLLIEQTGEKLPVDEAVVAKTLDPLYVTDLTDEVEMHHAFLGLLRTSTIFLIDQEEAEGALYSDAPELPELPPLPFRRVWVELQDEDDEPRSLIRFVREEDGQELAVDFLGVGIVERRQGALWDMFTPFHLYTSDDPEPSFGVVGHRLSPKGLVDPSGKADEDALHEDEKVPQLAAQRLLSLGVTAAHLITARRVPRREVTLPRAQRREQKRRLGVQAPSNPKIYFIDLRVAGEDRIGKSDREYHVRWLVRGHWRHIENGSRLCPCHGWPATWVDAYVKGPPGAPWKGRAIYRAGASEDEEQQEAVHATT